MKRSNLYITILLVLFSFSFTLKVFSQPGALDVTWGTGGIVTTDFAGSDDKGFSIIQQTDGKIVVAGLSKVGASNDFAVVRYDLNGVLDPTFGTLGTVTTPIGTGNDVGQCVVQQSDGKLVVVGFTSNGSDNDFAIVRYNTDGSLDPTFGTGGIVTTTVFPGSFDQAHSVAIQSDGKLVVVGYTQSGLNTDFAIIRYDQNGGLDFTFQTSGIVTTDFATGTDEARTVVIQPDGKIVVGGWSSNGTDLDFAVARFTPFGTLDNTFDLDGKVTTPIGASDDKGYSLILQNDQKIILAGHSDNGTDNDFALVRYNPDGSLDNTFDLDGKVTTGFFPGGNDLGYSAAIQIDNKILVAGQSLNGTDNDFSVARFNPDGSLDLTFDSDGKVTTNIGGLADVGWAVAVQYDSKTIVAGSGNVSNFNMAVTRYNGCETIDLTVLQDDTSLTATGFGLYQWVLCDSVYSPIPGETNPTLPLANNGTYAVVINLEICQDTSDCIIIDALDLNDISIENNLLIYPNPVKDIVTVYAAENISDVSIRIISMEGKRIFEQLHLSGNKFMLDLSGLTSGIYIMEVLQKDRVVKTRLVKK